MSQVVVERIPHPDLFCQGIAKGLQHTESHISTAAKRVRWRVFRPFHKAKNYAKTSKRLRIRNKYTKRLKGFEALGFK